MSIKYFIRKEVLWIYLIFSSLTAYIVPLLRFGNTILARDWSPFNTYSHFVHSCYWHYKVMPLHNPYLLGGMDLFADPQSKVFSPLVIFDILFSAPYANLLSLISLSVIGGYGMYRLLKYLNIKLFVNLLIVFMFQHATWFAMHGSEGHIIFGSFQLVGLIMYLTLRLYEPKYKIYMAAVLAFMILDGGMYAFIFSCLMIFFSYLFRLEGLSFIKLFRSLTEQWKTSVLAIIVFVCLSGAKILPLMLLHGGREPVLENIVLNAKTLLVAFFYPVQYITLQIDGTNYSSEGIAFHEIGSYIGILSVILISWYLIRKFEKRLLTWIVFILFFFWIGSGIGFKMNPWYLFQHIPVINNAHIQTRLMYLVLFGLFVLLAFALNHFYSSVRKEVWVTLSCILIVESFTVGFISWNKMFQDKWSTDKPDVFQITLNNTKVDSTVAFAGIWGYNHHILKQKNTACKGFMAPAFRQGNIQYKGSPDYKGEVYFLEGEGRVDILEYTPRGLIIDIESNGAAVIQFNTNFLWKWIVNSTKIIPHDQNGLLTLSVNSAINETVTLKYRPKYLYLIFPAYFSGLILLLIYIFSRKNRLFKK